LSSRKLKGSRTCIWLANLDAKVGRSRGRKIPRELAVPKPTLKEVVEAAKELGLDPIVEEGKSYPKSWWQHKGRVLVKKVDSKTNTLRAVARKILENREKLKREPSTVQV